MDQPVITIYSSLSQSECKALLEKTTTRDRLFATIFLSPGTIISQIGDYDFRLRQKKSYNNSFAPIFFGKFSPAENGTLITGQFCVRRMVRVFMALWLGGATIGSVVAVLSGFHQWWSAGFAAKKSPFPIFLIPLIMPAFGWGLIKFGQRLGKADQAGITAYLDATFARPNPPGSTTEIPVPPQKDNLFGAILFFSLLGSLAIVMSALGISSYQSTSLPQGHRVITHFPDSTSRIMAFAAGAFLLFMAFGTWKKLRVVWLLGFVVAACSLWESASALPPTLKVPFSIANALVVAWWTYWWYKKRDHFED